MSAVSDKDRRHADLMAGFCSNLGVAYIAGAALQLILPTTAEPGATASLLLTGLYFYGAAHIVIERAYRS
jgi:hypothetical protein